MPIAAVAAAALLGEARDLIETRAVGARIHWDRHWHDVWNSCFQPAILLLLARCTKLRGRRA